MNTDFMQAALDLAREAQQRDEVPVGAVVVLNGEIIGSGYNRRVETQLPTAHAEILALEAAARKLRSWRLEGCELYVTLEPCPMCLTACQQARVQRVVYGAKDSKGGALSLGYSIHSDERTHHRFIVDYLKVDSCAEILKSFFANKRFQARHPKEVMREDKRI